MERFFYDQPQMFLEPSGISDSGAFSQSTFSELQSEEDKGNYQFVVVIVVASLNYIYAGTEKLGRNFSYKVQQHYTKSINGYIITRDKCSYFMTLTI